MSGGERKRVSVACGLLSQPKVIFMDEPTSGLDAAIAAEVMGTVKQLQIKTGATVLVTIHQPAMRIFHLFDGLVVLSQGRLAYFGPAHDEPLRFFARQGFICGEEAMLNAAEALLEIVSGRVAKQQQQHAGLAGDEEPPQEEGFDGQHQQQEEGAGGGGGSGGGSQRCSATDSGGSAAEAEEEEAQPPAPEVVIHAASAVTPTAAAAARKASAGGASAFGGGGGSPCEDSTHAGLVAFFAASDLARAHAARVAEETARGALLRAAGPSPRTSLALLSASFGSKGSKGSGASWISPMISARFSSTGAGGGGDDAAAAAAASAAGALSAAEEGSRSLQQQQQQAGRIASAAASSSSSGWVVKRSATTDRYGHSADAEAALALRSAAATPRAAGAAAAPVGIGGGGRKQQQQGQGQLVQSKATPANAACGIDGASGSAAEDKPLYANSIPREIYLLLRHRGVNRYVSPIFIFSRVVLMAILAALFASFYYSQSMTPRGIANVTAIMFLTVTTPSYVATVFVEDLILDREVYTREFHGARQLHCSPANAAPACCAAFICASFPRTTGLYPFAVLAA